MYSDACRKISSVTIKKGHQRVELANRSSASLICLPLCYGELPSQLLLRLIVKRAPASVTF